VGHPTGLVRCPRASVRARIFPWRAPYSGATSDYIRSFLRIKDPEIDRFVQESLNQGRYWPDPLVKLNPAFEPADTVDDLVARGVLVEGCRRIFRRQKDSIFVPFVDYVLRHGSRRGIKAIIVYPMNALCNSQVDELNKFLKTGFGNGAEPVTFARYTGQESQEERAAIAANPPDILLTNFMMLEPILDTLFQRS